MAAGHSLTSIQRTMGHETITPQHVANADHVGNRGWVAQAAGSTGRRRPGIVCGMDDTTETQLRAAQQKVDLAAAKLARAIVARDRIIKTTVAADATPAAPNVRNAAVTAEAMSFFTRVSLAWLRGHRAAAAAPQGRVDRDVPAAA